MKIRFDDGSGNWNDCTTLNSAIDFIVNYKFLDEYGVIERLGNKMKIIIELLELVIDSDPTIQSRILNEIIGSDYKVTVLP